MNSDSSPPALTILVHGLWQSGLELFVMRRRLQADGTMRALFFSYPTIVGSMSNHVRRLIECAQRSGQILRHSVAHRVELQADRLA